MFFIKVKKTCFMLFYLQINVLTSMVSFQLFFFLFFEHVLTSILHLRRERTLSLVARLSRSPSPASLLCGKHQSKSWGGGRASVWNRVTAHVPASFFYIIDADLRVVRVTGRRQTAVTGDRVHQRPGRVQRTGRTTSVLSSIIIRRLKHRSNLWTFPKIRNYGNNNHSCTKTF